MLVTLTAIERPLCGPHELDGPQYAEQSVYTLKTTRRSAITIHSFGSQYDYLYNLMQYLYYFFNNKVSRKR